MQRSIIFLIFHISIIWNLNFIEAGFLTNYPTTSASTGTTAILQDSYNVPQYTASNTAAVENIGYNYNSAAAPVVEKKIYVHVPPQISEQNLQYGPPQPPPRKHYKIIFVKAPSQPTQPPSQPEVEEKTLVYVLVKKPEPPIVQEVPSNANKPSKPEVYFINYKTQKEGINQNNGGSAGSGLFTGSFGSNNNGVNSGSGSIADTLGPSLGGSLGSSLGGTLDDNSLGGGFSGLGVASTATATNSASFGSNSNSFHSGSSSSPTSAIGGFGSHHDHNISPISSSLAPSTSSYLPPPQSYLPPNFIK